MNFRYATSLVTAASMDMSFMRDHRRAAGLTQEQLAERAGLSPRTISELERGGEHVPRRDTVALLVQALGLAGSDREAFEALVERRRRPRPRPALDRTPINLLLLFLDDFEPVLVTSRTRLWRRGERARQRCGTIGHASGE
jgi:transcriptional regulator with XRE-family HTH domain